MLRIYWNITTPIRLKTGQSIPLGLYPKSLGIYEMNEEKVNSDPYPSRVSPLVIDRDRERQIDLSL